MGYVSFVTDSLHLLYRRTHRYPQAGEASVGAQRCMVYFASAPHQWVHVLRNIDYGRGIWLLMQVSDSTKQENFHEYNR